MEEDKDDGGADLCYQDKRTELNKKESEDIFGQLEDEEALGYQMTVNSSSSFARSVQILQNLIKIKT